MPSDFPVLRTAPAVARLRFIAENAGDAGLRFFASRLSGEIKITLQFNPGGCAPKQNIPWLSSKGMRKSSRWILGLTLRPGSRWKRPSSLRRIAGQNRATGRARRVHENLQVPSCARPGTATIRWNVNYSADG